MIIFILLENESDYPFPIRKENEIEKGIFWTKGVGAKIK